MTSCFHVTGFLLVHYSKIIVFEKKPDRWMKGVDVVT